MAEADTTNQFVDGHFEVPPGIVSIVLGWDSMQAASDVCLMGYDASGKGWLLGYRKVPTSPEISLEAVYRAGFAAASEGWSIGHLGTALDDPAFAERMKSDLEQLRSALS